VHCVEADVRESVPGPEAVASDNDRRTACLVVTREVKPCCPFSIKVYVIFLDEGMRACNAVVTFHTYPKYMRGMECKLKRYSNVIIDDTS
jgi:hypothetical protein